MAIVIRKAKYLNNIIEQDHRAVKRVTRPMLGFKTFDAAQATLTGIELMGCVPPFTRGVLRHEIGLALGRALRPLVQDYP